MLSQIHGTHVARVTLPVHQAEVLLEEPKRDLPRVYSARVVGIEWQSGELNRSKAMLES